MEPNKVAVDFQTENDIIRLHVTLFDAEEENDNDSDGDEGSNTCSSKDAWDENAESDSDDDDFIPRKKRKISTKRRARIQIRGGLGTAAQATTIVDTWSSLISESMLDKIVKSTNCYIDGIRPGFARERDAAPTDRHEIRAFIGLLYMIGIHCGSRLSSLDCWDYRGMGIELFRLTMTHRRFKFLMRCVQFDEFYVIDDYSLESIDRLLNEFASNCQSSYPMGTGVSLDVLMGRKSSSKSSDHDGYKIWALTDSEILYTYNLKMFFGQNDEEVFPYTDENVKIVEDLFKPVVEPVQSMIADEMFVKFTAVLKELCHVGNDCEINFYDRNTKDATPVTTLSSTYDVYVHTRRRAVAVFFQMLNIAGINSQIIYTGNGNIVRNRRSFLRQLALDLTKEHMVRRGSSANLNSLPSSLHARLLEVTSQTIPSLPPTGNSENKRKLCQACLKEDKSRKSTKYRCTTCGMYLCLSHVTAMCKSCYLVANNAVQQTIKSE